MRREISKSGLFLLELIFVILFFSVSSAVCVRLFVKANAISVENTAISQAVIQLTTAAETYKACDGEIEETAKLLSGKTSGEQITVYYDKDWNVTTSDSVCYTLYISETASEGQMKSAHLKAIDSLNTVLYELDIQKYIDR